MKNLPPLDSRLALCAGFVRENSAVADVGTDHAYLPIHLILSGRCTHAVAADINEGPLTRARLNCEKQGVCDKVTLCLADGLKGLPLSELGITDIVICGMGGELIAAILGASDYVRNPSVRLILQPMSQAAKLRAFLCENGFAIVDGGMAKDRDRLYQCIVATYDERVRTLSPAALELGEENIKGPRTPEFCEALDILTDKTRRAIEGRRQGGLDCSELKALLLELLSIKGDNNDSN